MFEECCEPHLSVAVLSEDDHALVVPDPIGLAQRSELADQPFRLAVGRADLRLGPLAQLVERTASLGGHRRGSSEQQGALGLGACGVVRLVLPVVVDVERVADV